MKELDLSWTRFAWIGGLMVLLTVLLAIVGLLAEGWHGSWLAPDFLLLSTLAYFAAGWRRARRKFGVISAMPSDPMEVFREFRGPAWMLAGWFVANLVIVFLIGVMPLLIE
jgi:hypothetical protein